MQLVISAFMLFALAGCAVQGMQDHSHHHAGHETHFEPHYSESLFKVTENKLFSVEMLLKQGNLTVGSNGVDIIIHGQGNKDVEDATIMVTPWMPEHGHGVREESVVTERGAGLYSVDNVNLTMAGLWELTVVISAAGKKDQAVFSFPGVKLERMAGHNGKHASHAAHGGHGKPRHEINLAKSVLSERKLFQVSYAASPATVPLNRIHTWEIGLQDKEGKPVTGATIKVDGDMPEHGHGLPTKPKVTKEKRPGLYIIEGMKFTMPGWWTVTFYLDTEQGTDSVTFNLDLK